MSTDDMRRALMLTTLEAAVPIEMMRMRLDGWTAADADILGIAESTLGGHMSAIRRRFATEFYEVQAVPARADLVARLCRWGHPMAEVGGRWKCRRCWNKQQARWRRKARYRNARVVVQVKTPTV